MTDSDRIGAGDRPCGAVHRFGFAGRLSAALVFLLLFACLSAGAVGPKAGSKDADVDYGPYMADVEKKVKTHWFPPKTNRSDRVVALWKIHQDGTVSDIKITTHGKTPKEDDAAIKAIMKASPYAPLPKGSLKDVDIQFTFDFTASKIPSTAADQGNNLANLEALVNIVANATEIQLIWVSPAVGMAGLFMLIFLRGRRFLGAIMLAISPLVFTLGLAIVGIIAWLVGKARDANLLS